MFTLSSYSVQKSISAVHSAVDCCGLCASSYDGTWASMTDIGTYLGENGVMRPMSFIDMRPGGIKRS